VKVKAREHSELTAKLTPEFIRRYLKQEAKGVRKGLYRRFIDQPEGCDTGNALICHGYRGNIRAPHFKELANQFDDAGFNVASFDLPRYGKSRIERPELHGQIVSFAELVRAMKSMLFAILDSSQKSKVPTVLVGYSIGTLVILRMLQIYPYLQNYICAIVLVAAPLRVDQNARKELLKWKKVVKPLFKLLVRIRPHFAVAHYEPDEYSKDDPHHFKGAMNAWTANQILVASEKARVHIKKIRVPVLFIHGEDDQTSPLDAMEWAYGQIGTPRDDKEKIVYDGLGHLVLQKHRRAIEDIIRWSKIRVKLAPPPPKIHDDPGPEDRIQELFEILIDLIRRLMGWAWKVLGDFLSPLKFWGRIK
jgi:alpha-beta hydrolase superfamily lysophospholipase